MLLLAATPLGNLHDASARLKEVLSNAALIVAEDTRSTKHLLHLLAIDTEAPVWAMHEHNEREVAERILDVAEHSDVVVVSDAGMPGISDPGYFLVQLAHQRSITVSPIPGPSAVIAALSVSGLPTNRWCMEGFLPRRGKPDYLRSLSGETRTMVFFESPHRLSDTLTAMATAWGGSRRATVCRELTKKFEEVRPGTLEGLASYFSGELKGEITLVVEGAGEQKVELAEAVALVKSRVKSGEKPADAARAVARETGHPKRELYDAARETGA